jgi:hypothetical protein
MKMGFEKQKPSEESQEGSQAEPEELGTINVARDGNTQERKEISFFESSGAQQDIYDSRQFQKALDDLFTAQDKEVKVPVDGKTLEAIKDLPAYEKKLENELAEKHSLDGLRYIDSERKRFSELQKRHGRALQSCFRQRLEYRNTNDEEIDNAVKDRMERRIAFVQKNQKTLLKS